MDSEDRAYYTYMVRCSDNSLYTGYTTDLIRRIRAHNSGRAGAKYTRSRRPVELVYYEKFATRHEALVREAAIKKLTRAQKIRLVESVSVGTRSGDTLVEKDNGNL